MPSEDTDLERRVLAHEEILQALMAQLAEGQPGFLDRMRDRFAGARRGAYEQDFVETADYAEAFLREVMRLVRVREVRHPRPAAAAPVDAPRAPKPFDADRPIVIRTWPVGRVWHVTRDEVFFGDYLAEAPARAAAAKAARDIEGLGGRARVIFEAPR
jgi:phage terminase large subunit-like protein